VAKVLASYRKLYRAVGERVAPGGTLVAACCTSRVARDAFLGAVRAGLGPGFRHERDLPTEPDHPVGFPQADYLKVSVWRRA
jgi:23S rRNA G2069 N7-methylase RlmK/C1962 C5-methylase RlmI